MTRVYAGGAVYASAGGAVYGAECVAPRRNAARQRLTLLNDRSRNQPPQTEAQAMIADFFVILIVAYTVNAITTIISALRR